MNQLLEMCYGKQTLSRYINKLKLAFNLGLVKDHFATICMRKKLRKEAVRFLFLFLSSLQRERDKC